MADIIFDPTGSLENFKTILQTLGVDDGTVLILACDDNAFQKESIDPVLLQNTIPLLGIIVPSVIYNNKKYDKGSLFVKVKDRMTINIIHNISQKEYELLDEDMENKIDGFDKSVKTMFVFVDGLSKNIGTCVDALFDNYGLDINYIGGGSGSLSFEQRPSLFSNEGLLKDAFIYAYSTCTSSIGVSHGWKSINGPYQVTKSKGTVIEEIDYMPAFEVYKKVVDQYGSETINEENFFKIAKSFPFGLNTTTDEKIVRDPIVLNGTQIVCVGDVSEGSYIDILHGDSHDLINAVKNAAQVSGENMQANTDFTFFIDCISRVLFLKDDFKNEIAAVYKSDTPLIGALTFGEIANNGKDYLAFYTKTSVIGHISYGS